MKHILFVFAAFWLASQSATCAAAASPPAGKPNLVVIFIDDMGYGDIGPFGSKLNRWGIPYSNDMQRKSLETGERVVPLMRDGQVA